jgi:hypothetical protein
MAERQGVRSEILRAILQDDVAGMPDDVALAWRLRKRSWRTMRRPTVTGP